MGKCGALPLQNLVIILNNITGKISSPTNGVTEKAIIGHHHHHHRHHLSSPSSPIEQRESGIQFSKGNTCTSI